MITPVILSGGEGTRLWPLSRSLYPKQFSSLVSQNTLFQDTILRLPKNASAPIIICNEDHRFLAAEQLRNIKRITNGIILEPIGKNTAPAIALAAIKSMSEDKNSILLVLSADHLIKNVDAFHHSIKAAEKLVKINKLVTFGIVPTSAEIGYGYIESEINKINNYYEIKSFIEKPNKKNAEKYFSSGKYLWNSGMFMFKSSVYLNELEKFAPDILNACKKSYAIEKEDMDFIRVNNKEFCKCPSQSVDYAVMEHTKDGVVVPLDANWTDIGSWNSLWEAKEKDGNGNVCVGDVITDSATNTIAYSSSRLVSIVGVSNLIIVDTPDALLVADKQSSQKIKKTVNSLKKNRRSETENHRKVFRPWGYYDSIDIGTGFQVKHISVKSGEKLSLQKHMHRAEHWVVVSGIAKITCGNKVFYLKENQSTFIPKGEVHRLENCEQTDLKIIEIQTGDYLGEDDIIRLEDSYHRS